MARTRQPADFGPTGMQRVMAVEFTYADAGTPFYLPETPADAVLDRLAVQVDETFDSGTNDLLEIGNVADPNGYSPTSESDLRSATGYQALAGAGALGVPIVMAADEAPRCSYASTGAAPTKGKATILAFYYYLNA